MVCIAGGKVIEAFSRVFSFIRLVVEYPVRINISECML